VHRPHNVVGVVQADHSDIGMTSASRRIEMRKLQ